MTGQYLTGGELTALTMVYWTNDPFQHGRPSWLVAAVDSLLAMDLVDPGMKPNNVMLTPKGQCLMDAINAIQEPVNQWVIP